MKSFWLALASLSILLVGCAPSTQPAAAPAGTETSPSETAGGESQLKPITGEFKVALITPGPVSDAGWSAMAFQGLKGIQATYSATVNNEVAAGAKIKDAMRSYAQEGYQLVIGHGFEYNDPAVELAKDFPTTVFVSSSGGKFAPNAGAFRFYLEQGFYLAGVLAADMSKTGKIATVGIDGIPSIASTFKAFEAGAKATRPDIQVIRMSLAPNADIQAAKQAALSAIDQGADLLIHQANAAAQGVFDAAKEKEVLAFGANLNQNDNPSGAVLASAIIVAKPAFIELAGKVKDGTYKGGVELYGMDKEAIDFVMNPALAGRVPAASMQKMEEARKRILSGDLVVPKDNF